MRSARLLVMALVCALGAYAQAYDTYTISYTAVIEAGTTALAVQLPATGNNQTEVADVSAQCSAQCSVRFEVNGAAASTDNAAAATITALNPETTPSALVTTPKITAWYGTGVPTGTVVSPNWTLPAGALVPFGSGRILATRSGNTNYIIRLAANYTGTVTFFYSVRVRR